MKDNFSAQADKYVKFRPTYPPELFDFLLRNISERELAWDCATGNGQVAVELAKTFAKVHATDISQQQLQNAKQATNVVYQAERAEHTSLPDQSVDLITIAQAIHWFNFEDFFKEVKRVLKPNGLFAAIGYSLMKIDNQVDEIVEYVYRDVLGSYWDEERKHIDNGYADISFPIEEIEAPALQITTSWTLDELLGYLQTWSAWQHYIKANGDGLLQDIRTRLQKVWGNSERKTVCFPLLLKVGRLTTG